MSTISLLRNSAAGVLLLTANYLNGNLPSNASPFIRYDITEIKRTPMEVREIRTSVSISGGPAGFDHQEILRGSRAPTTTSGYCGKGTRHASVAEIRNLCTRLRRAKVFELHSDAEPNAQLQGEYEEYFSYEDGRKKFMRFYTRPNSASRLELRKAMLDFAKRTKLDQPPFDYSHTEQTEGDTIPPREVELKDLLANPADFHGKRVSVTGFYRWEFEGSSLGVDKDAVLNYKFAKSVWVNDASSFAKINPIQDITGSWVRAEGVFLKGPEGHMGGWPGAIRRLTRFDPIPEPGSQRDPDSNSSLKPK